MDPLGFAFQNFDLSGRWRDVEYESYTTAELDGKIAWRGDGKTRPVDAAGQLPRGEDVHRLSPSSSSLLVEALRGRPGPRPDEEPYVVRHRPPAGRRGHGRDPTHQSSDMPTEGYPLRDLLKALDSHREIFLESATATNSTQRAGQ